MTTSPPDLAPDQRLVLRILDPVLAEAGYERRGFDWTADPAGSFVAVSAVRATEKGIPAYSFQVGWRFDAFDDPPPEPSTAHGCVRAVTFDQLAVRQGAPLGRVGGTDDESLARFEQRLAMVATKELATWGRAWLRPEGFRDFLSARDWHLGAAWASALLGQSERAKLELMQAAHRYGEPLDGGFDRQRADLDEALAAVFASRHGLAGHLSTAEADVVGAFSSDRTVRARQRVTDPQSEHRRLQVRHRTYASLCLALVEASEAAGSR